jgi:predicted DNA-binding transcriptional regulator AlpA
MSDRHVMTYKRPRLIGKAAVAATLKIAVDDVDKLACRADFPRPTTAHGGVPLWDKAEIEEWENLAWLRQRHRAVAAE